MSGAPEAPWPGGRADTDSGRARRDGARRSTR